MSEATKSFHNIFGPPVPGRAQELKDAIAKYLPKVARKDYGELLWSSTAYPMGDTDSIIWQIVELAVKTDGTLEQCRAYADMKTDKAMQRKIES